MVDAARQRLGGLAAAHCTLSRLKRAAALRCCGSLPLWPQVDADLAAQLPGSTRYNVTMKNCTLSGNAARLSWLFAAQDAFELLLTLDGTGAAAGRAGAALLPSC